jgi:adenine-specific DNA-methyltransferase
MATSKGLKGSDGTPGTGKTVTAIQHDDAKRKNIPTAEYQSVLEKRKRSANHILAPSKTAC